VSLYYLNVTLHVLAAFLWLGGMFFLAAVGAPVLRKVEPPALRAELFGKIGTQFRLVGWIAIAILILTGVGNLYFRGMLRWELLTDGAFWATQYGHTLAAKLGTVLAMVLLSVVHDFVVGPLSTRVRPGTPEAIRLRRRAALLARINAVIGIILVAIAVRLARGG
jgi:putative copper resistance protein D